MAEILTSDLMYGRPKMGRDANNNPVMEEAAPVAKRGEKLPKDFDGDVDELRASGVLMEEEVLQAMGGFEPAGGRVLPENLGRSMSANAMKAAQARVLGEQMDENQEELSQKSQAGEPLDLGKPEKEASDKEKAEIQKTQRAEVRANTPAESPEESELDKRAETGKNQ